MKKKYYAALLAVVVTAFTGYNVYQSQKADASLSLIPQHYYKLNFLST